MKYSFNDYLYENHKNDNSFVISFSDKIIEKLINTKLTDSTNDSLFYSQSFKEPMIFLFKLNISKNSKFNIKTDSHFKDLPWEKLNFDRDGYAIDANTKIHSDEEVSPEIIIHLAVDPNREPKLYTKLHARLIDILVHETHHLGQKGINREPFNKESSEDREEAKRNYKYFLLDEEVESMVNGMYARSKYSKIPLDYVFYDYLSAFIKTKYISTEEYSKILKTWVKYAVETYPDANFSKKVESLVTSS